MGKVYVYLLRSLADQKFYIGSTTNMKRRLYEHNKGKSLYTKNLGQWELVGYEVYEEAKDAREREMKLKNSSRMRFFFKKRLLAAKEVAG